ncbi:MAG TPA: hypothetical protein ENF92_04205 [Desulfobacteraceae bacterium]|nr:hypothetical protein [Desulfobacteraceae bacterium]
MRPGVDPLSPQNKLIMSVGVLGGTGLQEWHGCCNGL